jgi:hypothetical protein
MNDRELLILAAKAIGAELHFATGGGVPPSSWLRTKGRDFYWNPLTDDGDALRLAVKLQLVPYPPTDDYSRAGCQNNDASIDVYEDVDDCPYKATRRAIVRAASEIGKAMP